MADKIYCSQQIYRDRYPGYRCSNAMKVMHNGKPYCGMHDPEKVAAKRAERDKKWEEKRKKVVTVPGGMEG